MVTRVTRDLLDIGRGVNTGIDITAPNSSDASFKVKGNASAQFSMDGVPIGATVPADGTFENLTVDGGTLDATNATVIGIDGVVPIGGVIMFNAAFAGIPANFQLCNGTNGTPDMTDQFVYGTNNEGQLLDSGGSADAVVVQHNHGINDPGHAHTQQAARENGNDGSRSGNTSRATFNNISVSSNTTGISIQNEGVSGVDQNLPPFIKLAFIQRMS